MKQLIDIINEHLIMEKEDPKNACFNIYFQVKVGPKYQHTFFCMTEDIPWNNGICKDIKFKNVEQLKQLAWECFNNYTRKQVLERLSQYAESGFTPYIVDYSVKLLEARTDKKEKWQQITYDKCQRMVNAQFKESLGPRFQKFLDAFNKRADEIKNEYDRRWKEDFEIQKAEQLKLERERKEWIAQISDADREYYSRYGYPWERINPHWVGD